MAAKARLSFACVEPQDLQDTLHRSIGNAVTMQRVVSELHWGGA
jgi:hypothetical protein